MSSFDKTFLEKFILEPKGRNNLLERYKDDSENYYLYKLYSILTIKDEKERNRKIEKLTKSPHIPSRLSTFGMQLLRYKKLSKKELESLISDLEKYFRPNISHKQVNVGTKQELKGTHYKDSFDNSQLDPGKVYDTYYSNLNYGDLSLQYYLLDKRLDENFFRYSFSGFESYISIIDHPNFVKKVSQLCTKDEIYRFNSLFSKMTLKQLDEFKSAFPNAISNGKFVDAYLSKIHIDSSKDISNELDEKEEQLNLMMKFTSTLPTDFMNIKLHVIFSLLKLKFQKGILDDDLFLEYISIPKHDGIFYHKKPDSLEYYDISPYYTQSIRSLYNYNFSSHRKFIEEYLIQYFKEKNSYEKSFESYIQLEFLKRCFYLSKLYYGPESQYDTNSEFFETQDLESIRESVRLKFAKSNKTFFLPNEEVSLTVELKNVPKLVIKIFEINTKRYYIEHKSEIKTNIELDGLIPNKEEIHTFDEPSFRVLNKTFNFPKLSKRGVYAIELIGGHKAIRVLVRKGKFSFVERSTVRGHSFIVLDEENEHYKDAHIYMDGHRFDPDEEGIIHIPYTSYPSSQKILIVNNSDNFTTLSEFYHLSESYTFNTGFYIDRETLLSLKHTSVVVKPCLFLNNYSISVENLTNCILTITTTDLDGIETQKEVKNIKFKDNEEYVYGFQTPDRLKVISFTLRCEYKNSKGETIPAERSQAFTINAIDSTMSFIGEFLRKTNKGYYIYVLGKSGEPIENEQVNISLYHKFLTHPISVHLCTDKHGKVHLGELPYIYKVQTSNSEWNLTNYSRTKINVINASSDETISIPFDAPEISPSHVALFKLKNEYPLSNEYKKLKLNNGYLNIKGLSPGEYDLYLKYECSNIRIIVVKGKSHSGWIFGNNICLEKGQQNHLQINMENKKNSIVFTLNELSEYARAHVIASDFYADFDLCSLITYKKHPEPRLKEIKEEKFNYLKRELGDEHRYVLDRKYHEPIPGNTLTRPSLLLNPRSTEVATTSKQHLRSGRETYKEREHSSYAKNMAKPSMKTVKQQLSHNNMDFKSTTSITLYNLKPEDNKFTIDKKLIGDSSYIRILVIDEDDYIYQEYPLNNLGFSLRDTTLSKDRALDVKKHFMEQKAITELSKDKSFEVKDVSASQYSIFDSFSSVFNFYLTVTNNQTLREFTWIQNWPSFTEEEKLEKYNKYGCHELHIMIYFKDPDFFQKVIKPYLSNKLQKTFIDDYLLENDLSIYLESHYYNGLNTFERILLAEVLKTKSKPVIDNIIKNAENMAFNHERFKSLVEIGLRQKQLEEVEQPLFEVVDELEMDESSSDYDKDYSEDYGDDLDDESEIEEEFSAPMKFKEEAKKDLAEFRKAPMARRSTFEVEKKKRMVERESTPLYKDIETTKVYAERNYYGHSNTSSSKGLVPINSFWADYASCKDKKSFVSKNFIFATSSFAEMMFALSVMNLSFTSSSEPSYTINFQDVKMTITATSNPLLIFYKEIKKSDKKVTPMLVSQMFFDPFDRYTTIKGVQTEKYITDEFLCGKIYGCDYIVTNLSSSSQTVEVLLQIPQGSIPVNNGFYTRTTFASIPAYSTERKSYYFYFPNTGSFKHYPAHLSDGLKVIANAEAKTFQVVNELTKHDVTSWEYISQAAEPKVLYSYLEEGNVHVVDLRKIAWRMHDKSVYNKIISILTEANVYNETLWGYSFKHKDFQNIIKYIFNNPSSLQYLLPYTKINGVIFDPVKFKITQHLEYWPIVNARAHQLGSKVKIMNFELNQHYEQFLKYLCGKPELEEEDYLELIYYFLLQDRITDAKDVHKKLTKKFKSSKNFVLVRDYIECYLDFYNEYPKLAKKIAEKYIDYPVKRWNNLFATVRQQIEEIDSGIKNLVDADNRHENQSMLASKSEVLEFEVENNVITIHHQNIDEVEISYYEMDIELLFSSSPFVTNNNLGYFANIKPNKSKTVALKENSHMTEVKVHKSFRNSNVMIEISSKSISVVKPYFSHSLFVSIIEKYGQLRVCEKESGKPIPKSYIKVYAKHNNGSVKFYKDGYTDLRGGFDYTSLNTPDLDTTTRFSILIISPNNGTRIVEASPPKR